MRFYPEKWLPIKDEATKDRFEIVETDEKGKGLKTKVSFSEGDLVFAFTGVAINWRTLFTLQAKPFLHIEDPYVMGRVLHSCNPNMSCDMETLKFYAKRNIEAGEFLTMDYDTTEEKLFQEFECNCGSENCRGTVTGYSQNLQ